MVLIIEFVTLNYDNVIVEKCLEIMRRYQIHCRNTIHQTSSHILTEYL